MSDPMVFRDALIWLLAVRGKEVLVTVRGAEPSLPLFLFFSSTFEKGWDPNMGEDLGHDPETIELQFANGALLAIDPTRIDNIETSTGSAGSETLIFAMGGVIVSLMQDDAFADSA